MWFKVFFNLSICQSVFLSFFLAFSILFPSFWRQRRVRLTHRTPLRPSEDAPNDDNDNNTMMITVTMMTATMTKTTTITTSLTTTTTMVNLIAKLSRWLISFQLTMNNLTSNFLCVFHIIVDC